MAPLFVSPERSVKVSITNGILELGGAIQSRGAPAAVLQTINPLLKAREIMVETNTGKMKIGDGIHNWNDLEYAGGLSSETLTMTLVDENETEITKEVAIWN